MRDLQAVKKLFSHQLTRLSKVADKYKVEAQYQEEIDAVEYNKINLPYYQDMYTVSGISGCASQGLVYQTSRRYMKEKEALKMELETFYKYSKNEYISVVVNYFDYPHLADLKITRNEEDLIIFFKLTADKEECLNH